MGTMKKTLEPVPWLRYRRIVLTVYRELGRRREAWLNGGRTAGPVGPLVILPDV
ncbi:hypothetical protein BH23GEM9_BH23GEM9_01180 [soil metagenome]